MLDQLRTDVRNALRGWARRPLPVFGAILTLAVAVGVNLAMFGLVDRALLGAPALVQDPARVFTVGFGAPGESGAETPMTTAPYPTFQTLREALRSVASAAAFQRRSTHIDIDRDQLPVEAMLVSGDYLEVLGVRPFLGPGLASRDDVDGAPPVALVSHAFWQSALSADPSVIGRSITVGGLAYRVSGVMPAGFSGHDNSRIDVWVPFASAMRDTPGWASDGFRNVAGVVVRLAPQESTTAAASRISPAVERRVSLRAIAGSGAAPHDAGVAWWLCGVSLLVLAIGLANAATLLMVRGAQSRQDSSIRAAMGASHATLVRQVLVETALLSGVALLVSLRLATWMDDAVRLILFPSLVASTGGSRGVWAAALLSGALTALVTAATTISQLPRDISGLRSSAPQAFAARRSRTTRALLVVQTALSVLLLASAGLVGLSLRNLWAQDFGMTLDHVMVVDFDPSSASVPGQDQLFSDAIDRLRQTPGIDLVSPIDSIPFSGFNVPPISVPGLSEPPSNGEQLPYLTATTPALLKILGIQVVAGRSLTESDERGALVVLVNESLARGAWPGESAIGKCIRIGFDANFNPETFDPSNGPPVPSAAVPCREVVGVTRDVRQRSVLPFDGEDRLMQYFVPYSQVPIPAFASDPIRMRGLLVRTASDAPALLPTIRRLTLAGRVDLPFLRVRPYSELLERQMRPWVAGTRLLGVFSALALGVAAVGLYAAFAHAVTERRREMAIRMAVGSRARAVLILVLREALALATLGSVIGCVATVIASRAARSLLFGTSAADPVVLGGAATLMLLVAVLATLAPARNAAHANPSLLLRSE